MREAKKKHWQIVAFAVRKAPTTNKKIATTLTTKQNCDKFDSFVFCASMPLVQHGIIA